MATTGPDTSSIAFNVASLGGIPSSMWCSTASTTTMASSTTRPMARTRPKSESVLMEKPNKGNTANVPISETGTASKRDQGRPPALEENKNHQHHQRQRLPKGLADFANPFGHRLRGVNRDLVIHVGREAGLQFCHELFDAFFGFDGVGVGELKQGENGRGFAIVTAHDVVIRGAQFDAGHVPQAHHRPVRRGAENDAAKFVLRREPALGEHGVSEFLSGRGGTAANFAGRIDGVLAVDGVDDLRDGDIEFGQLVGFHPNSHGVLPGAENRHLRNARHPAQRVAQVDIGVVGEKLGAARAFGRIERRGS